MTVGENIRRMRKARGLTIKQLGEMVGVSESYIRAYESGRRNPKPASLQNIAEALAVNPEVLKNSDFDGIAAMHRLFQIFRQYGGSLVTIGTGEEKKIAISFDTLILMRSWFQRYEEYEIEVEQANALKNNAERANALMKAEESFDLWMDIYPQTEYYPELLKIQQSYDQFQDWLGDNPNNPD